ncbi:Receptor L-domain domain-containing protein [Caenorhabditis elegans]|nr:Receptor L-domain domain-containing protein [Caenorhabditis elegans]CCD72786.1 Receptor L-domain domain-containing protein [Caenorhabditis elegans]|eukprot:NP_001040804.1 Insulin/EGF-Receptor L Domain protein [Caenorhabditis elegans]
MTNFQNLSFLAELYSISSVNMEFTEKALMHIANNFKMKRLGFPKLHDLIDKMYGDYTINLQNLHPDFCLTFDEMAGFLNRRIKLQNLHARYCADVYNETESQNTDVCKFQKLSTLKENCTSLFGDVVVDANDGRFLYKLFYVGTIFGSLKIQYSKIEGLFFLSNLVTIANLDGRNLRIFREIGEFSASRPAVLIRSNKFLTQAVLPALENVISVGNETIVLYDNEALFENNDKCLLFRLTYNARLPINNQDCGKAQNLSSRLEISASKTFRPSNLRVFRGTNL